LLPQDDSQMSIMKSLKQAFIRPMFIDRPTTKIGSIDTWRILPGSISSKSIIISGGVGKNITFEEDLARTYGCRVILVDPSPTGIRTMQNCDRVGDLIDFRAVGIAANTGALNFGPPENPDEGSFRKGNSGDEILTLPCVALNDLSGNRDVDLLKIDIEGFEYEVIDAMLRSGPAVDQLCVEIHTNRVIDIQQTIFSAMGLILRLYRSGYRIIYNDNMDFTFAHHRVLQRYA
jgi:FkbM family methyltransferase